MTTIAPTRSLPLAGVFNFRDLGGYPTRDGRAVRWRVLFRADGLGRLTSDDVDALRSLSLKTVVDLRTSREIDERGRFPYESYPVTFHHLSVIDQTWDLEQARREDLPATEFLHRAYTTMLADGASRFAAAIELLADADALPAVFHCAAGKDRTGLLAALVLGAIGVDHDVIVGDYALTQASMDQLLAAANERPDMAARVAAAPRSFFTADPDAMTLVLADVERAYGSVRAYVHSIGVAEDALERLERLLLTDG